MNSDPPEEYRRAEPGAPQIRPTAEVNAPRAAVKRHEGASQVSPPVTGPRDRRSPRNASDRARHGRDRAASTEGEKRRQVDVEEDGELKYTVQEVNVPSRSPLLSGNQRIKELEGKLKTAEETRAADLGACGPGKEDPHRPRLPPVISAEAERPENRPLGAAQSPGLRSEEDLMYEFGTWALQHSGRRALQKRCQDRPEGVNGGEPTCQRFWPSFRRKCLIPSDPRFTSVPEGEQPCPPIVEVSAGPSAEAATTTGRATRSWGRLPKRRAQQRATVSQGRPANETS
nr:hypothetical protein Iba_chr08aCG9090 [Ipomoea batatas]